MWWGLRLSGGETGAPRTGPPSSPSPLPEITTSSLYRTSYISPPLHRVNRLLCQIDYANDMNVKGGWNGVQIYRQGWLKWSQRQYHHQEWYHYPNRAERGVCRFMDQSVTGVKIQSEVIEMWRTVGLLVVSEAPGNNARDKVMKVNCKKCRPWHTMHWWLCNYCNYIFKISETNRQHSSICSSSSQIIKSFKQLEWKVESLKKSSLHPLHPHFAVKLHWSCMDSEIWWLVFPQSFLCFLSHHHQVVHKLVASMQLQCTHQPTVKLILSFAI